MSVFCGKKQITLGKLTGNLMRRDVPLEGEITVNLLLREKLDWVLSSLTERECIVMSLLYGIYQLPALSYKEVAKRFMVTRERIRQIEYKALRKLRNPNRAKILLPFYLREE